MKKFTKTLSIVLLIAMCVSMFTVSAFADVVHSAATCGGADGDEKTTHANTLTHVAEVAATCTTDGMEEYWKCPCGHVYADEAGTQYLGNWPVIAKLGHNIEHVPTVEGTCTTAGLEGHYKCTVCGETFADDKGTTAYTPVSLTGDHKLVTVDAVAPTCVDDGVYSHAKCTVCGKLFDASTGVEITAAETVRPATGNHDYDNAGDCKVCGADNPDHKFALSGANPAEFDAEGTYVYTVDAHHTVTGVKAGGYALYNGQGFYYADGKVTVMGSAVASLIGTKPSIELTFTASDGCVVGGFTLNNATSPSTVMVDGYEQKGTLKGSIESVFFTTDDSNVNNVKVYSTRTGKYVDVYGSELSPLGGGRYTYTFGKEFLNSLPEGTYYIRSFFGDGKYASVGTIIVTNSDVTVGSSPLSFTNSTINSEEFKYISGGLRPELYCEMFRDSDAKLQISNDGYSWKNVSVLDYYIEQSNGKDTSYAWLKASLLDSQKAASNVYFRVIIPAAARGATEDAVSNWVKVTTGHTLAPVDTNKHVINSSKNLRFVCSDVISEVYVGGQNLAQTDPDAFKVSADGKYVTLYASFLNERTAGSTYTLSVLTKSGEKLSTTFQILTTAQASASPRTGDDSNIALWSAFLLMSGAAVVAVLPRLKKED